MNVAKGKVVAFDYNLTSDDGKTIDRSKDGDPLQYLHGSGTIIRELERSLEGKSVGDQIQVSIGPDDGYGRRNDDLLQVVSKQEFSSVKDLTVGMQFRVESNVGELVVTVIEVNDDTVTLDGNHALAGLILNFDVTIREIREATADEIEHGHAHGAGGFVH